MKNWKKKSERIARDLFWKVFFSFEFQFNGSEINEQTKFIENVKLFTCKPKISIWIDCHFVFTHAEVARCVYTHRQANLRISNNHQHFMCMCLFVAVYSACAYVMCVSVFVHLAEIKENIERKKINKLQRQCKSEC